MFMISAESIVLDKSIERCEWRVKRELCSKAMWGICEKWRCKNKSGISCTIAFYVLRAIDAGSTPFQVNTSWYFSSFTFSLFTRCMKLLLVRSYGYCAVKCVI